MLNKFNVEFNKVYLTDSRLPVHIIAEHSNRTFLGNNGLTYDAVGKVYGCVRHVDDLVALHPGEEKA